MTASPNAPTGQVSNVSPSELWISPAAYGTAFFSTGGTGPVPVAGGVQIVKWIRKELVALNVAPDPVVSVDDSADDAVV